MVNATTRPEGAEAPSPGQSPWVNQQSAMRPVRAKAFKNPPFNQHFNTQKTYRPEKKSRKRTKDVNVKCKMMHSGMIMITIIMLIEVIKMHLMVILTQNGMFIKIETFALVSRLYKK